jgi:hypothetical protein
VNREHEAGGHISERELDRLYASRVVVYEEADARWARDEVDLGTHTLFVREADVGNPGVRVHE